MEDIKEIDEFNASYQKIIHDLTPEECNQQLNEVYDWIKQLFDYNVTKGKRSRGMLVVRASKLLAKGLNKVLSDEDLEITRMMGWSLEILQAFALIVDDIVDRSKTRRGQLCWHQKVGLKAFIDARILYEQAFHILSKYVSHKSYYVNILDAMHKIMRFTTYGQSMDLTTSRPKINLEEFSKSRLYWIYKYKTSYYTIILPVKFALFANSVDMTDFEKVEHIFLKIGYLFQLQDDYFDCFADYKTIGKIGTDIEDGKCCWPIVTALELSSDSQRQILKENYGIKSEECVRAVKQVYTELKLVEIYEKCEKNIYTEICTQIQKLRSQNIKLYPKILEYVLAKIYKRKY